MRQIKNGVKSHFIRGFKEIRGRDGCADQEFVSLTLEHVKKRKFRLDVKTL